MRLPPLYGAAIFQDTCVALIKKVRVGGVEPKVIREKSRGEGSLIVQDTIENVSEPKFFF